MNEDQLSRIEERLAGIERRLIALETRVLPESQPVAPPPRWTPSTYHQLLGVALNEPSPPAPPAAPPVVGLPPVQPQAASSAGDTEYQIGAKVLPMFGAAISVLGMLFAVKIAIQNGWITPQIQFGLELAGCLVFLSWGFLKLNEKENFGQILIAVGSCGLYFSFAAAEAIKKLITGEQLVAAFLILSFLNLAFGLWRGSKFFLALGFIGGEIGAMMPMRKENYHLSAALHFIVVVPSLWVVIRHRWQGMLIGLSLLSLTAIGTILQFDRGWILDVGCFYANALLCVIAYGIVFDQTRDWDAQTVWPGLFLFGTALWAFLTKKHSLEGSEHVAALSAAGIVIALAFTAKPEFRRSLLVGAAAAFFLIAPGGVQEVHQPIAYSLSAIACVCIAAFGKRPLATPLAWLAAGMAAMTYLNQVLLPGSALELKQLGAMLVAFVACGWASTRKDVRSDTSQAILVGVFAVLGAIATRSIYLQSGNAFAYRELLSILYGVIGYGFLMMCLAIGTRWISAVVMGWLSIAAAGAMYYTFFALPIFGNFQLGNAELPLMLTVLLLVIGVSGSTAYATRAMAISMVAGAIVAWPIVTRIGSIAFSYSGVHDDAAVSITWTIYAAVLIAIGFAASVRELRYTSLCVFAATVVKVLLYDLANIESWIRVAILMGLGLAMIAGGYWYIRFKHVLQR